MTVGSHSLTISVEPLIELLPVFVTPSLSAPVRVTDDPLDQTWLVALAGVIVGFLLKAAFDLIMEHRRNAREDRLRFVQDKMRTYAEYLAHCSRLGRRQRRIAKLGKNINEVDARIRGVSAELASRQEMTARLESVIGNAVEDMARRAFSTTLRSRRRGVSLLHFNWSSPI